MYIAYVKIGLQEVFKIQIIIFLLHNMLIVAFFMVTYTGHMASFPWHCFPAYNSTSCAVFETRYAVFLLASKLAVPSCLRDCAHAIVSKKRCLASILRRHVLAVQYLRSSTNYHCIKSQRKNNPTCTKEHSNAPTSMIQ